MADNLIKYLPASLRSASSLQKLLAYGNRIEGPEAIACLTGRSADGDPNKVAWISLDSVWLEGNPLGQEAVMELLQRAPAGGLPGLKSLGLDLHQVKRTLEGVSIMFPSCGTS